LEGKGEETMIRKGLSTIVLFVLVGLLAGSMAQAQTSLYQFTLGASVTADGKVYLKWTKPPGDSVLYYLVYRASMPNALAFTRIDSTTANTKIDTPPASTVMPVYLYVVEAKMKSGASIRSNIVTVYFRLMPKIDVVRILSEPPKTGRVGTPYTYQVHAVSSDSTAKLKYELTWRVTGMTIDSTGLFKWTPDKKGIFGIQVTVVSSKGGKASQQFYVTVTGPTGTVAGIVTDTTGKPIPKVTVRLYGQNTIDHFGYYAVTDSAGKYSILKIDFGTYFARAVPMKGTYLEQWYDGAATIDKATPIPVRDVVVTVSFKLKSKAVIPVFTVSGTVTDTVKKPIKGAAVVFTVSSFGFNSARSSTGDWSGETDCKDVFDLGQARAFMLGMASGMPGIETPGTTVDSDDVSDFRLDGNSVYVLKTKTDSLGRYSLRLPQGSYIAQASASGYYRMFYNNKSDFLSADIIKLTADVGNIDFALRPILPIAYGEISGTVVDSVSGGGVVSRVIGYRFFPIGKDTIIAPRAYLADTDSLGSFELAHLPPGDYIVLALPLGHFVPSYYSLSGFTRKWSEATKINVNGNSVAGITIYVVPMLKSATGYSSIRGGVRSTTRPPNSLGKMSATSGVEGSLVYAVDGTTGQVAGYAVTNSDGSFTVPELAPGSYTVSVDKMDYTAASTTAAPSYDPVTGAAISPTVSLDIEAVATAVGDEPSVPMGYVLEQNYPNPFNPSTQILFFLPNKERVSLTIYSLLGQKVTTLVDGMLEAGTHVVSWNGRDSRGAQLSSGVYFYSLKGASFTATRKMILMK
jgi:5-hydroxyisourate hydrolase-like protein (transthyretin family)